MSQVASSEDKDPIDIKLEKLESQRRELLERKRKAQKREAKRRADDDARERREWGSEVLSCLKPFFPMPASEILKIVKGSTGSSNNITEKAPAESNDNWALKQAHLKALIDGLMEYFISLNEPIASKYDFLDLSFLDSLAEQHAKNESPLFGELRSYVSSIPSTGDYAARQEQHGYLTAAIFPRKEFL